METFSYRSRLQVVLELASGFKECALPFDRKVFLPSLSHTMNCWGKGRPLPELQIQVAGRQEERKHFVLLWVLIVSVSVWRTVKNRGSLRIAAVLQPVCFDDCDCFYIFPIGAQVDRRNWEQTLLLLAFVKLLLYD